MTFMLSARVRAAMTYAIIAAIILGLALIASAVMSPAKAQDAARPEAMLATFAPYSLQKTQTGRARDNKRVRAGHMIARVQYGASLAGVSAPVADKAREIVTACGSTVISARRHTRVAGTGRMSLHASGRAVDMRGNPGCIYAHLTGWPGGYSTDYGRVKHVHISLGGSEDGLRFAHGGHRRHYAAVRVRYAHR